MKNIINNKTVFLKTTVIVKLNCIISDLKVKSGMDNVYNYDDIDKLSMIDNDLDKYILKTISANQTDSHQTLMKLLK